MGIGTGSGPGIGGGSRTGTYLFQGDLKGSSRSGKRQWFPHSVPFQSTGVSAGSGP